jgi:hypothetical protein
MADAEGGALSAILDYLIRSKGSELGIPTGSRGLTITYLSGRTGISPRAIRAMLDQKSVRPTAHTRERLAEFFATALPKVQEHWFLDQSVDSFRARIEPKGRPSQTFLGLPVAPQGAETQALDGLCGTYICYRYSHGPSADATLAREVLTIERESGQLKFRLSFFRPTPANSVGYFTGVVASVGRCLVFVGVTEDDVPGRALTMIVNNERDYTEHFCQLGIMTTTRVGDEGAPFAASAVIIRSQHEPADLAEFTFRTTVVGRLEEIVTQDFGAEAEPYLRLFLDNRPAGVEKEPDLQAIDGNRLGRDRVLRANLAKFRDNMPGILERVLQDRSLAAPFKAPSSIGGNLQG